MSREDFGEFSAMPLSALHHLRPRERTRVSPYALGLSRIETHPNGHAGPVYEWVGKPQLIFRPRALVVFGATNQTLITKARMGRQEFLCASLDPIPARLFEAGYDFADLARLLAIAEGARLPLPGAFFERLRELPPVDPNRIIQPPTCELGSNIDIETRGPVDAICLWGHAAETLPAPAYYPRASGIDDNHDGNNDDDDDDDDDKDDAAPWPRGTV